MTENCCERCGWFVRTYRVYGLCDLTEDTTMDTDWCAYFIEGETLDAVEERDKAN